jgi:hypothetical protein
MKSLPKSLTMLVSLSLSLSKEELDTSESRFTKSREISPTILK